MKRVLATKYFLVVTMVTLIAHHNAWLSAQLNAWVDKVIADDMSGKVVSAMQWLAKAVSIGVMFKMITFLYDHYLWKLFFPNFDISGVWEYTNSYSDGSQDTTGTVVIKQTPYSVELIDGTNTKANPHHARFVSTSAKFSEDAGKLVASYTVDKYAEKNSSKFATKRSVVELEIVKRRKMFLFGDRPRKMTGKFFNCVLPEDQKNTIKKYRLGPWNSTYGTCSYKRIKKK